MTVFDLLFIALFLTAAATLTVALVAAVRGQRRRALRTLTQLAVSAGAYVVLVYLVTALSPAKVLPAGQPQCLDDWCFEIEHVHRTPDNSLARVDIDLRIFSRARRAAQRENGAKDVYLVDRDWKRYNPLPAASEPALNTLLQPGQSVNTRRSFELPASADRVRLALDHSGDAFPFCVVIGACGAFHKGETMRLP